MAVAQTTLNGPGSGSYWSMVWSRFRKHKMAIVGSGIVILMILVCFVGPPLYSAITGDVGRQNLSNRYALPTGQHWFGTDDLGRDVFLLILRGGQVSIEVGMVSAIASVLIGALVG
jgi:ABC-type dipeptide/oligopeptide/nickel transport system permease subunit